MNALQMMCNETAAELEKLRQEMEEKKHLAPLRQMDVVSLVNNADKAKKK
jgi:hypothetical protein